MPVKRENWVPAFGENHKNSKLTNENVIAIRQKWASGVPQARIAKEFGISTSQINRIVKGKRWARAIASDCVAVGG